MPCTFSRQPKHVIHPSFLTTAGRAATITYFTNHTSISSIPNPHLYTTLATYFYKYLVRSPYPLPPNNPL
jgi:hypothetical protein